MRIYLVKDKQGNSIALTKDAYNIWCERGGIESFDELFVFDHYHMNSETYFIWNWLNTGEDDDS